MSRASGRILKVQAGEIGLVLTMGLLLLINSMALEFSDVVAVSGFLANVSVSNILIVWVIDMILIGIAASVQSFIVDRFNRIRVMQALVVIFIIAYALLRLLFLLEIMPPVVNYALLFLLVEQQWIFFPLVFWVLASDVFDLAQAKRLFPLIAAFSFIGQILGLSLASAAPALLARLGLSSAEPLTFNVLIYIIAFVIILIGTRAMKIRERRAATTEQSIKQTLSEGVGFVREVPSFRYLMIAMFATAVVLTISDYHFLSTSDSAFVAAPPGSFQTFYGLYRLVVTVMAIMVQTLLAGRLIERFQLKNVLTILPMAMVLCLGLMFVPRLSIVALGRALFRIVQTSIDEPARKTLLSLVPDERRGRVSLFMDSYLFVAGAILGCALIGGVLLISPLVGLGSPAWVYLGIGIAAALVAGWAVFQMRNSYEKSMLNWRLRRRSRGASVLNNLEF